MQAALRQAVGQSEEVIPAAVFTHRRPFSREQVRMGSD